VGNSFPVKDVGKFEQFCACAAAAKKMAAMKKWPLAFRILVCAVISPVFDYSPTVSTEEYFPALSHCY
jgi:hypothetical protein